MIFVTVGNYLEFPRLIEAVDTLRRQGRISEEVFLQVGRVREFRSEVCGHAQFLPPEEYRRRIREAAVVISHGGSGTLIDALIAGKVPVVVPRQSKYGELVDDHQRELAEALSREGRAIVVYDLGELPAAIEEARRRGLQPPPKPPQMMIELIGQAIEDVLARRRQKGR